ncbi:MAG: transglutaminase family protein [Verrucomicrobiota bacterium]
MSDITYRVRHRTAYRYTGRVDLSHGLAHLKPLESDSQSVLSYNLILLPEPGFVSERTDYYGNNRHYFEIQQSHDSLESVSTFTVVKQHEKELSNPLSGEAWDGERALCPIEDSKGFPVAEMVEPSVACPENCEGLADFVAPSLVPGRDTLELAADLMSRIYTELAYVPGATTTTTPLEEVVRGKKGVCQDFSHLLIAALRQHQIPSRYVSGYLETVPPPGQEKLQGADATHAWVEVWSKKTGWIGFDPTNNLIPTGQHIKIAHGRDYFDVQPVAGLFIGSGSQSLEVEVDVERIS